MRSSICQKVAKKWNSFSSSIIDQHRQSKNLFDRKPFQVEKRLGRFISGMSWQICYFRLQASIRSSHPISDYLFIDSVNQGNWSLSIQSILEVLVKVAKCQQSAMALTYSLADSKIQGYFQCLWNDNYQSNALLKQ